MVEILNFRPASAECPQCGSPVHLRDESLGTGTGPEGQLIRWVKCPVCGETFDHVEDPDPDSAA